MGGGNLQLPQDLNLNCKFIAAIVEKQNVSNSVEGGGRGWGRGGRGGQEVGEGGGEGGLIKWMTSFRLIKKQ